ncbi:MAG: Sensor histidine kinase TmoS [Firmicutes bacterium ADurb.Bin419]|nr:MAG: Sensor histidine kinase TmoS [Firmicutes bacterium ADurb.Bin419]
MKYFTRRFSKFKALFVIIAKKLNAFNIVIIYGIVGALWIMLSDKVLSIFMSDPAKMVQISIYKGWFFVACTSLLLYILIDSSIKEINKSKNELRLSEERYRMVINNTTDGLWEWDIIEDKINIPSSLKKILSYEDEEISHKAAEFSDLIHPDEVIIVKEKIKRYLSGETPKLELEFRVKSKSLEYLWIQIRGQAIKDKVGNPVGVIGTVTDVNERKMTEVALTKTMKENERLLSEVIEYDKLRTEFITNISHEFRTPLNVILSVVQVLSIYEKKGNSTVDLNKINKYMKNVKQNCYRLLKLINNLIDVNRIDSGFFQLQMSNENIVEIVKQITNSVNDFVNIKQLKLTFSSNVKEKIIACDADKVERLMLNLISNSIKYTKLGGEIFIDIVDMGGVVKISVKDTGIGIEKDKIPIIFDRFRQVNTSLVKDSEGSGIGLYLVKSLVEMHNGEIKVISEPGVGTEFIVSFPVVLLSEKEMESIPRRTFTVNNDGVEKAEIEFSDIYVTQ